MKRSETFKTLPFAPGCAIAVFGIAGFGALALALWQQSGAVLTGHLIVLLLLATVTARAKAKLCRGTTISFLTAIVLMAVIRDSAAVAIISAIWGVTVQTVSLSKKVILHRIIFNAGMIALTVAAASWNYRALATSNPSAQLIPTTGILATIMAALVYFAGNSISISFIIAVTQRVSMFEVWIKHFMYSAQSFLLAGLVAFFLILLATTTFQFMPAVVTLAIVLAYYCAIRHAAQQSTAQV